jgi:hypothetical protein
MMDMLIQTVVWLNRIATQIGSIVLAPVGWLPGWLSVTVIAVVTGIGMLVIFKYTSNQAAIKKTRNGIKGNLLALSLFKEDIVVGLRCQCAILWCAAKLIALSLVPMLVMFVPMSLLLGQLGLWYQARPLKIGEDAVVTVQLAKTFEKSLPGVDLQSNPAIATSVGPIRVPSKHMVCWSLHATEPGTHRLVFDVNGVSVEKELAVGEGYVSTSLKRPKWDVVEVLLHPKEMPFGRSSPIQSIEIEFPERLSMTSGTNSWLIYWFAASMIAALAIRPLLKVNL